MTVNGARDPVLPQPVLPGPVLITETEQLERFCDAQRGASYITVDTEFLRDKTFWPLLCLVQIAGPASTAAIDPLAPGIDLTPLLQLMGDPAILKVFHAGRQDVEVFYKLMGTVPAPVADTQIMAMVAGFGDSIGYETLASKLAGARIDKSSRFTDWSLRPLTERQLDYAIADVIHLRPAYEKLAAMIADTGRSDWIADEMAVLTDPATYRLDPVDAWKRIKVRGGTRKFMAILRELAAWREETAQSRDIPRGRVLRDESLLEIASHGPRTTEELTRIRGLSKGVAEGEFGQRMLDAVARALSGPLPAAPPARPETAAGIGPIVELLRVLLRLKAEEHDVAQRLIASGADLDAIAADDDADTPVLSGWRREVFGAAALELKHGRLGLTAAGRSIRLVTLDSVAVAGS